MSPLFASLDFFSSIGHKIKTFRSKTKQGPKTYEPLYFSKAYTKTRSTISSGKGKCPNGTHSLGLLTAGSSALKLKLGSPYTQLYWGKISRASAEILSGRNSKLEYCTC